ncbi:hypothetical protein MMC13_005457 [Lambiella insularis]|nr:hypothetical protein [Lambiella insularis]
MYFLPVSVAVLAMTFIPHIAALASTDSWRDADIGQSGYLPNHNMDPNVVASSAFGLLWKVPFNTKEQFYAKPLVYTPLAGGPQLVFLASSQNYIRTLNAKTGALVNSRQVHTPFLQSDIGCTDIPYNIGIIGTPTIDPATDIVYFFAKTYIANYRAQGATGTYNGVYYFHGVNINTLVDVFPPILIDGTPADNAPAKYFIGGTQLQRPSLLQVGSVVYGAFGSGCDLFNYTGLVIGVDVNKQQIVAQFATESGPLATQSNIWSQGGGGGEGGIWMSGMGLASDGERLFFVTGNGAEHQNQGVSAPGTSGLQTLGEAAVNLAIAGDGKLSLTDYFQPYDYQNLDGGDQDFGSGGIVLLDPTTFHGTGVSKMAITGGKNGKVYVLNANNLGGYKMGTGQGDNIIQTIITNQPMFGAYGSYPLDGGYIYSTPVGAATYAYKLGFTAAGVPNFLSAGQSNEVSAGRIGVGIPTVTSYQGQAGTGIVWMSDPNVGLRAWHAVPQNNILQTITLPQVGGANKFQRPAFGDSRLYVTDSNGIIYCLGSPVNLPLNCTSPVQFGNVALGSSANATVTCKANIAITSINGLTVGNPDFVVSNASLPKGPLAAGATFKIPVTWDLTGDIKPIDTNASLPAVTPGVQSTALTILTTNAVGGYSTQFPVSLTGTEVSSAAFLVTTPRNVDFAGLVLLPNQSVPTVTLDFSIANDGLAPMTILGYAWTNQPILENPTFTNVTFATNGTASLGFGFSSDNLPIPGTVIQSNSVIDVASTFSPYSGVGTYFSYLMFWTTGGTSEITLSGTASTAPIANFSISNGEGGWLPSSNLLMDFGDVTPASSQSRQIRICNNGGSVLDISKSKPPNGVFLLQDPTDLHEEQQIITGSCAYGTVYFEPNAEKYNVVDQSFNNTWTLNTGDLTFGVHVVEMKGTVVSQKVGPTNSTGQSVYTYLGCYLDSGAGTRLLPTLAYDGNNNTNANCQQLCYTAAKGAYIFQGTEYQEQCYCGNTPPASEWVVADNVFCTFPCTGNANDACGGNGGYISIYYDATRYTPGSAVAAPSGPITVNSTGNYHYAGCYSEATTGRALAGKAPATPANGFTIELCAAACVGYTYFGMEYSNECYCGNTLGVGSVAQTSTVPATNGCSMLCTGNSTEYCGGASRLNLYQLGSTTSSTSLTSTVLSTTTSIATSTSVISNSSVTSTSTTPSATPTGPITVGNFGNWSYLGCYTEATNSRALSGLQNPITGIEVSVEACSVACAAYTYFGVEYSGECYCDNVISTGSVLAPGGSIPASSGCSMLCSGNALEYCGGSNRLNMYQKSISTATSSSTTAISTTSSPPILVNSVSSTSINSTSLSSTTLSSITTTNSTSSVMPSTTSVSSTTITSTSTAVPSTTSIITTSSITSSTTTSTSSVKPTTTSVASTTTSTTTSAASTTTSTSSATSATSATTSVSSTTTSTSSVVPTTTSTASTTTISTTTTTSSAATLIPTPGQNINGAWVYLGCANETTPRALSSASYASLKAMTLESCQAYCSQNNYGLAGLEYSSQCYCGNALQSYSAVGFTGCNMACSGNSSELCGGSNRLSVYNLTTYVPPTTAKAVGSYVSQGCYKEATNGRLLGGPSFTNTTGMTVELCVNFCQAASPSQAYAGVEYGQECYCASSLPSTTIATSVSSCNTLCKGNNKEFCGASSLLNVYYYNPNSVSNGVLASNNSPNPATISANTVAPTSSSSAVSGASTATPAKRRRSLKA